MRFSFTHLAQVGLEMSSASLAKYSPPCKLANILSFDLASSSIFVLRVQNESINKLACQEVSLGVPGKYFRCLFILDLTNK